MMFKHLYKTVYHQNMGPSKKLFLLLFHSGFLLLVVATRYSPLNGSWKRRCDKRTILPIVKFMVCAATIVKYTGTHMATDSLTFIECKEWKGAKKVCNLCKNKSHKMIWGVFGSLWIRSLFLCVWLFFLAYVPAFSECVCSLFSLFVCSWCDFCVFGRFGSAASVVLETLTRIINISNNKPIWAKI